MRKNTKANYICLLLAGALITTTLSGCGVSADDTVTIESDTNNHNESDVADSESISKSYTNPDTGSTVTDGENAGDENNDSTKPLAEQVLFPISEAVDDNCRNYYEIFPASFYDSDADGMGDINGITYKLDYIAELGCNGIWLTPVMASPSYHKYDTTDYYLIDPSFGTNDDFANLTKTAHEKGIKVIIDMVINHSSSEHPWFISATEYLRSLPEGAQPDCEECPYVDYYNFSREKLNNSYCQIEGTDWYYEAVFYYTQPDLNLRNGAVVDELENVAKFWIDLGIDGFRMDAAMHYDENDTQFNIDFLSQYYNYCQALDPDFYMVSEVWASEKTIADYYGSNIPSFFNFDAADSEGKLIKAGRGTLSAENFVKAMVDYQETFGAVNSSYIDAPFITNHDMGRVANALQSDLPSMKMTAGLLLTMNGSPFIYYGEEIGMKSKGKKDENKRLHMNWSNIDATGQCADPQDADAGIEQSFPGADVQAADSESLLYYYKEALAIRNANPEIARGSVKIIDELTEGAHATITKNWNDSKIAIIYNTADTSCIIDISGTEIDGMSIVGVLCSDSKEKGELDKFMVEAGQIELPGKSIIFCK